MKRRKNRDLLFICLLLILVGSLVFQGYRMLWPHKAGADPVRMLYEVSQLQIQVLGTSLRDAANTTHTDELNPLKLAAYSAGYSHERLAKTFGDRALNGLSSISDLVNTITEWQIGGDRPLVDRDKEMLKQYSEIFAGILPAYQNLLSEDGHVIASQADELKRIGKELSITLEADK